MFGTRCISHICQKQWIAAIYNIIILIQSTQLTIDSIFTTLSIIRIDICVRINFKKKFPLGFISSKCKYFLNMCCTFGIFELFELFENFTDLFPFFFDKMYQTYFQQLIYWTKHLQCNFNKLLLLNCSWQWNLNHVTDSTMNIYSFTVIQTEFAVGAN